MLAAPRYLGLASLVNDGPVAMLELSRLFELAGGTRGMTNRPFDLERPPSPRFLSACTPLSLSLFPSLSTPFNPLTELIGKSIGGTAVRLYAAKINPKRAQKKSDPRLYSPANRSSRSLALTHRSISIFSFPPSPPLVSMLALAQQPIRSFFAFSLASTLATQARIQARCDYSSSRFAFRLSLIRLYCICSPAVLLLDPSSLSPLPFVFLVKFLKSAEILPPKKSTWISNTIR